MNYKKTLEYMYSQLPMYQRQGKTAFKKDLTNIIALCEALGHPQERYQSIHIAGTNGKGTVSHLIAFGLQLEGYKVGLYTSPHYRDFRERIKVNGQLMDKASVTRFIANNASIIALIKPSFFEITVAMAFDYFAQQEVDYAVIEVGLGGRLDSTNIINPALSVITNISYDHMDMLGDTLPKIAGEKAGIIKDEVPVVVGERQEEVKDVFMNQARSVGAPIYWAEDEVDLKVNELSYDILLRSKSLSLDRSALFGPFQVKNIITAIAALNHILPAIDWDRFSRSFTTFRESVSYLGRWQFISRSPDTLVDSAHNEAGIQYLTDFLHGINVYDSIHIVCGYANDKDLSKILPLFPKTSTYYFAKASVPRGLDAQLLEEKAEAYGLHGKSYSSVRRALAAARRKAKKEDLIFVGGSIFVVAEVV